MDQDLARFLQPHRAPQELGGSLLNQSKFFAAPLGQVSIGADKQPFSGQDSGITNLENTRPDSLAFIRSQAELYVAMLAAPPESLSDVDRQILALLAFNETDV